MLILCTGNICRSPMAEALLRQRLEEIGQPARVHSAGLLQGGRPASPEGVEVMRGMGMDTSAHLSRRMTRDMLESADLVLCMAREHLREAVLLVPECWPRAFTLKELVRRGERAGPRAGAGQSFEQWLAAVHAGRERGDLLGASAEDDVADPIGLPVRVYRDTANEIDGLTRRLVELAWANAPTHEEPPVHDRDDQVFSIIERELERQNTTIQLIASENFTSREVMEATGSVLTNKYAEGYPGKRYYGGNSIIDEVEELARERAKELFGAEHANVQPHSGANANIAVYAALLEPGDTVLGMRLDQGGHLTHGSPVNLSGKLYRFVAYGVTESDERLDYEQVRDLAREHRPKIIVAGATAYSRIIEPAPLRDIADEVGALLMFDAAHIAGLVAGGAHPNPVPYSDIVTFTTHKTLRGPRGGCILCTREHAAAIDRAVFPGLQGGPLEHVIAAKAVAFREASQPSFREYAAQIVRNAQALAAALAGEGFRIVSGGTDNHLMLVDLRPFDAELTGKVAQESLDRAGVTLNKNQIPNDPRSPFVTSGLRIGTAAVTTAGMREPEMARIASLIGRALRSPADDAELAAVRDDAAVLCSKFTPYPGL